MRKVKALDVAYGVGLPPVWASTDGCRWYTDEEGPDGDDYHVDLEDPQTAFGVALRLDAWERSILGGIGHWVSQWAQVVHREPTKHAHVVTDERKDYLCALASRVTQVGQDHLVRRCLGEDPKPGTLGKLDLRHGSVWRFDSREHGGVMIEWSVYPGDNGSTLGMCEAGEDVPAGYMDVPGLPTAQSALQVIYEQFVITGAHLNERGAR